MLEDIYKLNQRLSNIQYGWYDKDNKLHLSLKDNFKEDYRMQDVEDIEKNNYAVCWDLCELERYYFEKTKFPFKTILAFLSEDERMLCHSFLVFKANNKYYWFESSWNLMKGIREYESFDKILEDIKNYFYDFTSNGNYDKDKIIFYMYDRPKKNINCREFYSHCLQNNKKITTDNFPF